MSERGTEELRELATKATPGPWHVVRGTGEGGEVEDLHVEQVEGYGYCVATIDQWLGAPQGDTFGDDEEADAAFIAAASPDRVLALLDRIEELEGALGGVEALHREVHEPYYGWQVCAECSDDEAGHWAMWPCPTARAALSKPGAKEDEDG